LARINTASITWIPVNKTVILLIRVSLDFGRARTIIIPITGRKVINDSIGKLLYIFYLVFFKNLPSGR
jgi:hypothetical protein